MGGRPKGRFALNRGDREKRRWDAAPWSFDGVVATINVIVVVILTGLHLVHDAEPPVVEAAFRVN